MAALPWTDPQFLAVTAVALLAGLLALRPFLARRRKVADGACPKCAHCAPQRNGATRDKSPVVRIGR